MRMVDELALGGGACPGCLKIEKGKDEEWRRWRSQVLWVEAEKRREKEVKWAEE